MESLSTLDWNCSSAGHDEQPNPDVSGIGVIVTFSASAFLTFSLLLINYIFIFDPSRDPLSLNPSDHPNPVDRLMLHYPIKWFDRKSPTLQDNVEKLVILLSDQQLISGLALLVSGFLQLRNGISSYHWQMTIYLVWFSAFTHLATLTVLRRYLRDNPTLRWIRLSFMSALIALLIAALIPTGSKAWLRDGNNKPQNVWMPAMCFYTSSVPGGRLGSVQLSSLIVSISILLASYVTRVVKLFGWTSNLARIYLRTKLGRKVRTWQKILYDAKSKTETQKWIFSVPYVTIFVVVIIARACLDSFESVAWEILWLLATLLWGTLRLISTRDRAMDEENSFGFGQCLSIAMLSLFFLTLLQICLEKPKSFSAALNQKILQENTSSELIELTKTLDPHCTGETVVSQAPTDHGEEISSQGPTEGPRDAPAPHPLAHPRTTRTLSLEEGIFFSQMTDLTPITLQQSSGSDEAEMDSEGPVPPHELDLYPRLWYRGLVVFIFIQVLFLAVVILSGVNDRSNFTLLYVDLRNIKALVLRLSQWVTFHAPMSLLLYTVPFIMHDFGRPIKWPASFVRFCFQWRSFLPAARRVVAMVYFAFMALLSWSTLTGLPTGLFVGATFFEKFLALFLPYANLALTAYSLVPVALISTLWLLAIRWKLRREAAHL